MKIQSRKKNLINKSNPNYINEFISFIQKTHLKGNPQLDEIINSIARVDFFETKKDYCIIYLNDGRKYNVTKSPKSLINEKHTIKDKRVKIQGLDKYLKMEAYDASNDEWKRNVSEDLYFFRDDKAVNVLKINASNELEHNIYSKDNSTWLGKAFVQNKNNKTECSVVSLNSSYECPEANFKNLSRNYFLQFDMREFPINETDYLSPFEILNAMDLKKVKMYSEPSLTNLGYGHKFTYNDFVEKFIKYSDTLSEVSTKSAIRNSGDLSL
ncbi:MAG: hypothetical protein PHX09_03960 [Clostridia bacterium]|nr:hypothetical protein [Clostridia bacterium]